MRAPVAITTILVACLLLGALQAAAQQEPLPWSVGQVWLLRVRQYGRALPVSDPRERERGVVPAVQREFQVQARVAGVADCQGHACVQVKFTAAPGAQPTSLPPAADLRTLEYILTLDAQTGSVVRLKPPGEGGVSEQVRTAEGYAAVFPGAAFPVDWILARSELDDRAPRELLLNFGGFRPSADRSTPNTALRRSLRPAGEDGSVQITVGEVGLTATGEPRAEAKYEVEQLWRPGELWWRSFHRFVNGHIDMDAFLVSDPNGSGKPIQPATPCASGAPTLPGGPTWTAGQEWRFLVKESGGDPSAPREVRFEYHMRARVAELVEEDGRPCARIEFIAEDDAPDMLTALFTLVVDAQTWSPLRFEYPKKHGGIRPAAEAGCERALLPTMPGVPLDWVVLRTDLAGKALREEFIHFPGLKSVQMYGLQRVTSAPQADGTLKIKVGLWLPRQDARTMEYLEAKGAMCEVEQVWHPGELWWRSFRRYEHGRLNLEATLVPEGAKP